MNPMAIVLILPTFFMLFPLVGSSNPYPDERKVPRDSHEFLKGIAYEYPELTSEAVFERAVDVVRIEVEWVKEKNTYRLSSVTREPSGTSAFVRRSKTPDSLGSFHGILVDTKTNKPIAHDSLGTGHEYKFFTRAMTFRFPVPSGEVEFQMLAENPTTGTHETVLRQKVNGKGMGESLRFLDDLEVKIIHEAKTKPELIVVIYSDGYLSQRRDQFWKDAGKTVATLAANHFPSLDRFEVRGAFLPSDVMLGKPQNLGLPVLERKSFLGLYYPYWVGFGRWYNIVYPTRESRYRSGIGRVPYDYPIVLMDDSNYWGVGNFRELTAIPNMHSSFTYLLLHEFGHYFGLNEEYQGGGKTDLAFAPEILEPWSQNITFHPTKGNLKWQKFVSNDVPLPTPASFWNVTSRGPLGAYKGGYADTPPLGRSHKPGLGCVMSSSQTFCSVCRHAIEERVKFDLGN